MNGTRRCDGGRRRVVGRAGNLGISEKGLLIKGRFSSRLFFPRAWSHCLTGISLQLEEKVMNKMAQQRDHQDLTLLIQLKQMTRAPYIRL
jgi:hypothetical protein